VLSADTDNDADVLAITGASAALSISEIPFEKTVAGVRVGLVNNQFVINPTFAERKDSLLDLVVAGTKDGIVMVEAGAKQVTEAQVVGALDAAHAAIKQIVAAIDELKTAVGKPKLAVKAHEIPADFRTAVEARTTGPLADAMRIKEKLASYAQVDQVKADLMGSLGEGADAQQKKDADHIFHELQEHVMRVEALDKGVRLELRQSACVDSVEQELLITIAHPKHAAGDVKFWADFAVQALAKLKTQEGASGAMQSFASFLAQAPSHKAHKGKILWCRDGTETPDQECGWSTGGVYLFEIRREGAALVIDAAQSPSG